MRSVKKLFIHIGSHKTGTTSIQLALMNGKDKLSEQGISLFNLRSTGHLHSRGASNSWLNFDFNTHSETSIKPGLAKSLSQLEGNVLISAESFSWVFSEEEVRAFKATVDPYFQEVHIICYLRRQDLQLVSHYQQGSKSNTSPAYSFYGPGVIALPQHRDHFSWYLDYEKRIGMWADVFGDENIIVRPFEREQLINGDVVADFFSILGVDLDKEAEIRNLSRGFEGTKVGYLMNLAGLPKKIRRRIISKLDDRGSFLPTAEEAQDIYSRYKSSNKRLNERFGVSEAPYIFNDDFSRYPAEPSQQWSEESANQAMFNILRTMEGAQLLDKHEIKLLVTTARDIAKERPRRAYRLMRIAHKFRPEGAAIMKLMEKYEQEAIAIEGDKHNGKPE